VMVNVLNSYVGEKILVTGASGFIGSHLCRRLRDSEAQIHVVSRVSSRNADGSVHWQGDLADIAFVHHLIKEVSPDVIFHLAGEVTGSRNPDCVMPAFRGNLVSTVNLLTVASEISCRRFVLAGSLEEPEAGDREIIPCSPYAAAKWAGSAYARMFHALYQFPVAISRMFMVYGPAQRDLQKLIPYVILSLLRGEAPRLSSGTRLVDWIYVDDVVEGLLLAGQARGIDGMTIDLGSGQLVPIRDVVELLVNMVNPRISPLFGALPERPMEQVRIADVTKSETTLRWKPVISLGEGLQRTVEWYAAHFSDLEGKLIPAQSATSSLP
jgi:UDP-glucose 4-epimerase